MLRLVIAVMFIAASAGLSAGAFDKKTVPILESIDPGSEQIRRLKKDIAENLRSHARNGTLVTPLYFYKYKLKKGEHFFDVMARTSQDAYTLSSLNELPSPSAVGEGDMIYIPSARGIFLEASNAQELSVKYREPGEKFINISDNRWFLPGGKMNPEEIKFFRSSGFLLPLSSLKITSPFGKRLDPFTKHDTFHGGIDLRAKKGSRVMASKSGKVVHSGTAGEYGNLVVIEHEFGYKTYYGHLSKIHVRAGQTVRAGDIIAESGNTGRSNGPHLHFEVRKDGRQTRPQFIHR